MCCSSMLYIFCKTSLLLELYLAFEDLDEDKPPMDNCDIIGDVTGDSDMEEEL